MADESEVDTDEMTPAYMREWLESEVQEVMKAAHLRIKDATDFVTRFAAGELSAAEANERYRTYFFRWPEALPGVSPHPEMSDEQIVERMDLVREESRRSRSCGPLRTR
jgi:hypothetical protein